MKNGFLVFRLVFRWFAFWTWKNSEDETKRLVSAVKPSSCASVDHNHWLSKNPHLNAAFIVLLYFQWQENIGQDLDNFCVNITEENTHIITNHILNVTTLQGEIPKYGQKRDLLDTVRQVLHSLHYLNFLQCLLTSFKFFYSPLL